MSEAVLITSENVGKFFNLTLTHVDGLYTIRGECLNMSRLDYVEQNGRAMGICVIGSDWWNTIDGYTDEYLWAELHQYELCHMKLIEHVNGKEVEHLLDIGIAVPTTTSPIDYIGHHEYVRGDFTLIFVDESLKDKLFDKANIIDRLEEEVNNE